MEPILEVFFFRTDAGAEPVREWLKDLPAIDRKNYWRRYQDGSIWLAFGHAIGGSPGRWHLGGAGQVGQPHCPCSVHPGRPEDVAAAWFHKEAAGYAKA